MVRVLSVLAVVVGVDAHGALTFPPPRNNYGRVNPANRTVRNSLARRVFVCNFVVRARACSNLSPSRSLQVGNPVTGKWSHLPPSHINEGPCAGGACLWFSEVCFRRSYSGSSSAVSAEFELLWC